MAHSDETAEDLRFIRRVTERAGRISSPAAIPLLWAVVALVGFPLADWRPHAAGPFWMVATPLVAAMTAWIAIRGRDRLGQRDRARDTRQAQHWGGLLAALGLAMWAHRAGALDGRAIPVVVLLVAGVAFWTGGVHMDPPLRWLGLLAVAGVVAGAGGWLVHPWTSVGVVLAGALAAMAFGAACRDGR